MRRNTHKFVLFADTWKVITYRPKKMDRIGRRKFKATMLYGATYPKRKQILLRTGMSTIECIDTIIHEVFHAGVSYDAVEEFVATEVGTAATRLLLDFGLLCEAAYVEANQ